jgi:hypothetical protein
MIDKPLSLLEKGACPAGQVLLTLEPEKLWNWLRASGFKL